MNIFLNENFAQMPVMYIDVLLTPKRMPTLPLTSTLLCFVSNIAVCIFVYKGCKQTNFFTTTRCYPISIFIVVTYLYMLRICIYKIYNMIPLLCTKVKFLIKYLFGTRLHYF